MNPSQFKDSSGGDAVDVQIAQVPRDGRIDSFTKSSVSGFEWFIWPSNVTYVSVSDETTGYLSYTCDYTSLYSNDPAVKIGSYVSNNASPTKGLFSLDGTTATTNRLTTGSRLMKLPANS